MDADEPSEEESTPQRKESSISMIWMSVFNINIKWEC